MITILLLYRVSWRYRIRPTNAEEHGIGRGHDTVVGPGRDQWRCLDCHWASGQRPRMTARDWAVTLVLVSIAAFAITATYLAASAIGV